MASGKVCDRIDTSNARLESKVDVHNNKQNTVIVLLGLVASGWFDVIFNVF